MHKAVISTKHFLIEGGCNACGLKNISTFTIYYEDHSFQILDGLDLFSLIKIISQKNGWKELVINEGINDEKIIFKKGNSIIEPKYDSNRVTYKKKTEYIELPRTFSSNKELFDQANKILKHFFDIEPYEIAIVEP